MVAAEPRILEEPAPTVQVKELGASSVDFAVRTWMKSGDWWATQCDFLEAVKLRFDDEGIEIPFQQMDVNVRQLPVLDKKEDAA